MRPCYNESIPEMSKEKQDKKGKIGINNLHVLSKFTFFTGSRRIDSGEYSGYTDLSLIQRSILIDEHAHLIR